MVAPKFENHTRSGGSGMESNPFKELVKNEGPARGNERAGLKSELGSPDFHLRQLVLTPP